MEEDDTQTRSEPPDLATLEPSLDEDYEHHLFWNALNGSHGAKTMRFQGQIKGITVTVLLDNGSSDNFLQPIIANCFQVSIQSAAKFFVLVGNGNSLTTMGHISELPVVIQGNTLHLLVYLLPITGADLVLRAPWLKTLGPHNTNYNALSIKFHVKDTFITLYGDKQICPNQTQLHHIKRLHHTNVIEESFTLQFQQISPTPDTPL